MAKQHSREREGHASIRARYYLVEVVAKLSLNYRPGALVVALEGCYLTPEHRRAAGPVVVYAPMVHS